MAVKRKPASSWGPAGGWVSLQSLPADQIFAKLDLTLPGLEAVRTAVADGDLDAASAALLTYYREKYPLQKDADTASYATPGENSSWQEEEADAETRKQIRTAEDITRHVFQWGPYAAADYGDEMNWAWDPAGDIEWVAAVYRFYWAQPLVKAYAATGDEKYAEAFVDLTADWIAKHPLEEQERTHYVYEYWEGFAWLDLQTGIRATQLCSAFRTLVHADAFTPAFLRTFLASLYDHQVKTEEMPMGKIHNKAIFEQRGFVNVAYTFPEFTDARRWLELALQRTTDNFLEQVTPDGVQREWSGGYHLAVLSDVIEIAGRMDACGVPIPDAYWERVRGMYDYIFGMGTPDLGFPMFGDTARPLPESPDRSTWPLYGALLEATERFGDPKYAARARLDRAELPEQTSYAFRDAGMYALRDKWGPEQIYLGLHCSPPAISSHDTEDNGTFELYAYGRWLMPDSGFYTYGHDKEARDWHRQTKVHPVLTLDEADTAIDASQLLWHSEAAFDAVTVENQSYPHLAHRRTIWFVNKSVDGQAFFVLLDEAIGDAAGEATGALDLHLQFAPGSITVDSASGRVTTGFDDANLLVVPGDDSLSVSESQGWFAWQYGKRTERPAIRYRHSRSEAPAAFLTLLVPYRGTDAPDASATLPADFAPGADAVALTVSAFGQTWTVGRDLASGRAWCEA